MNNNYLKYLSILGLSAVLLSQAIWMGNIYFLATKELHLSSNAIINRFGPIIIFSLFMAVVISWCLVSQIKEIKRQKRFSLQPEKLLKGGYLLGKYTFNPETLTLSDEKGEKTLTKREADILEELCKASGKIIPRDEILLRYWERNDFYTSRSLDVFITKIRSYLSEDSSVEIQTIRGKGFKLSIKQ